MPRFLVIDDEPDLLLPMLKHAVGETIPSAIEVAYSGQEGIEFARRTRPDVILLDVYLPDQTGLEVFEQLRSQDARCPVIFITGMAGSETAIEAITRGAFDYLYKPVKLAELRKAVTEAMEFNRRMKVPALVPPEANGSVTADVMVGRTPAMLQVYKSIGLISRQDVTVLITGESGTGKELVARALYQHSRRQDRLFLAINSAALHEELLQSELFGHEKGSFTGAHQRRIGKFEQCNGGTLFLDEIGDMPLHVQAQLLRVIQERKFERLGGNDLIETDVRLIVATHRDLRAMVARELFREDLYYRITSYTIHLPPLRERQEDVPALVDHYRRRFCHEFGKNIDEVVPEAIELLQQYSWPGNIRELQNVLRQAVLQTRGRQLLPSDLPSEIRGSAPSLKVAVSGAPPGDSLEPLFRSLLASGSTQIYDQVIEHVDRSLLTLVLNHTKGNQVQASSLLGITRRTLRKKLRKLGLTVTHSVESTEDGLDDEEWEQEPKTESVVRTEE